MPLNAIYSAELVELFNCVQGKEHIIFSLSPTNKHTQLIGLKEMYLSNAKAQKLKHMSSMENGPETCQQETSKNFCARHHLECNFSQLK